MEMLSFDKLQTEVLCGFTSVMKIIVLSHKQSAV